MNITGYLISMGVSAVVCALMTFFLLKHEIAGIRHGKTCACAVCLLVLGWVLGYAGAKLLYVLLMLPFVLMQGLGRTLLSIDIYQMSYYGGMAGVILAAFLTARMVRVPAGAFLNAFAPAGAFMAAMARFSEYFLGMFGVGDYIEEGGFFPLAIANRWGEYYLAVFLFEGVVALIAMGISLVPKYRQQKECFVRTLFYLCLPQIVLESLRNQSIAWLFVRCEQLVCYFYVEAVLIVWSVQTKKRHPGRKGWYWPFVTGLIVCALTIAEEFALDKTNIPHLITYACMIAGVVALAVMEHTGYRNRQMQA